MAKAYAVFNEVVRDQTGYQGYVEKAVKTIQEAGGRIIVADDHPAVLEGQWPGSRTVVLEFDSADAASKWYDSAEYQAIIEERHASAEASAAILHGVDGPKR